MRDILFRAKAKHNPTLWVYGDYLSTTRRNGEKKHYIKRAEDGLLTPVEIIPETLGQYTGLTAKNETKVFEKDILDCITSDFDGSDKFVRYNITDITDFEAMGFLNFCNEIEVIGNTTDSPELLGGAESGNTT